MLVSEIRGGDSLRLDIVKLVTIVWEDSLIATEAYMCQDDLITVSIFALSLIYLHGPHIVARVIWILALPGS